MVLAVVVCFCLYLTRLPTQLYLCVILNPIRSLLPVGQSMIATDVDSPFSPLLKLAHGVGGLFAAIPVYSCYQGFGVLSPGPYTSPREKNSLSAFLSVLLFYLGGCFWPITWCFPLVFGFFTSGCPEALWSCQTCHQLSEFRRLEQCFLPWSWRSRIPIATILR